MSTKLLVSTELCNLVASRACCLWIKLRDLHLFALLLANVATDCGFQLKTVFCCIITTIVIGVSLHRNLRVTLLWILTECLSVYCSCVCQHPYTGSFCEGVLDAQPCTTISCENGGRCYVSGDGIPQCDCPVGTGGRLCQQDTLNECETVDNPCTKGFCIDGLRSYNCNCPK